MRKAFLLFISVFENLQGEINIAGVMMAGVYWRMLLQDIVPAGTGAITVVLDNSWNQAYQYQIDGPEVSFIGTEDRHDRNFDNMGVEISIQEALGLSTDPEGERCLYRLRVYPTEQLKDEYESRRPLFNALSLVGLFLFSLACVALYVGCAKRLHRNQVLSGLRSYGMLKDDLPSKAGSDYNSSTEREADSPSLNLDHELAFPQLSIKDGRIMSPTLGQPITEDLTLICATEGESQCTAFCVDLMNLESFPDDQTREMVISTIHNSIDEVIKERGIKKIGVIKTRYIAASTQFNHAVIMCRCAQDIAQRVSRIVLVDQVTDEGDNDAMIAAVRIGIHSGPVIAKDANMSDLEVEEANSGFRVFGDTVNRAAQMELHGRIGRIHASSTTARLIVASGFDEWVTKEGGPMSGDQVRYWISIPHYDKRPTVDLDPTNKPVDPFCLNYDNVFAVDSEVSSLATADRSFANSNSLFVPTRKVQDLSILCAAPQTFSEGEKVEDVSRAPRRPKETATEARHRMRLIEANYWIKEQQKKGIQL